MLNNKGDPCRIIIVKILILLLCALSLVTSAFIIITIVDRNTTDQALLNRARQQEQQDANRTIYHYFTYLNSQDYPDAYAMTNPAFRNKCPYSAFVKSYKNTISSSIIITSTRFISSTRILLTIIIHAIEQSTASVIENIYLAYYTLLLANHSWQISAADTTSITHNH
jgi:hypothetical protein